ncbi:MAG: hypothetical protein M1831_002343 [Alyxoria varia]|nr:MAG: hypothetical protein M1831_002343 [Alyxoria varia]
MPHLSQLKKKPQKAAAGQGAKSNEGQDKAHLLQHVVQDGDRRYTLHKSSSSKPTKSAHPASFNPDDPNVGARYAFKRRVGLVPSTHERTKKALVEKEEGDKDHEKMTLMRHATENKAQVLKYLEGRPTLKTYIESYLNDKVEKIVEYPNTFESVGQLCALMQGHHNTRRQPELDYPLHNYYSYQSEVAWDKKVKNAAQEKKKAEAEAKANSEKDAETKGDSKAGVKRKRSKENL